MSAGKLDMETDSHGSGSRSGGSAQAPGLATADIPPNHTIYIHGLNEKMKVDELKRSLYHAFSPSGNIMEIHARKTPKLRGQAWIVFDDLGGATKAMREMHNFNFFGKPLQISFAKTKSDVVAKIEGTFKPRAKPKTNTKRKGSEKKGDSKSTDEKEQPQKKKSAPEKTRKEEKGAAAAAALKALPLSATQDVPNRVLFVENLPEEATPMMLAMLFDKYDGYQDARMVPGKKGIAFVEFADVYQASMAKDGLQNFKVTPTQLMRITFGRQ